MVKCFMRQLSESGDVGVDIVLIHLQFVNVRLKLAFCTTCAVRVLVLAQGPSF